MSAIKADDTVAYLAPWHGANQWPFRSSQLLFSSLAAHAVKGPKLESERIKLMASHRKGQRDPIAFNPADLLTEIPAPPPHLSPEASDEWRGVAAAAIAIGTLRGVDLRALEMLSRSLASERQLSGLAREDFATFVKVSGLKPNLVIGQLESVKKQAIQLLADFGLTPRGRERLGSEISLPYRLPPL